MAPDPFTLDSLRLASHSRQLSNRALVPERFGAVVAVYGARRQVGVSTIASSLASLLAAARLGEIALAEIDPRGLRARARVTQATIAQASLYGDRGARETPPRLTLPGLDAWMERRADAVWTLELPARPRTPMLTDAKAVEATLSALRARFSVNVIAVEHQVNERTLAALDAATRILVVTAPSVPSLRATQRVLRLCRRLNYPDEKLCVVVNRSDAPGALPVADVAAVLRRELCAIIPERLPLDLSALAEKLVG